MSYTKGDAVATHTFKDGPNGERCTRCNRSWLDILSYRDRWIVGELGITCDNQRLNSREIEQLEAKVERLWRCGKI